MTVILAIDQSSTSSGWAIFSSGECVEHGTATNARERRCAVLAAFSRAMALDCALMAVLEDHGSFAFSRGNMSCRSLLGMGAARGRWEQELELHSIHDVRHADVKVWRKAVLGLGNAKSEACKAAAKLHAHAVLGEQVGEDEAEAVCIGLYAVKNFEPKKRRKADK